MIFFCLSSIVLSADWGQLHNDFINSRSLLFSYNQNNFSLSLDSTNTGKLNTYDEFIQKDNFLYSISGGFLNKYSYIEGTGLNLVSQIMTDAISTPFVYDGKIVLYSTSTFYIYDENLNLISSIALSKPASDKLNIVTQNRFYRASMECFKIYSDFCIFPSATTDLEIINLTDVNNPSADFVSGFSDMPFNYKPIIYSSSGTVTESVGAYCNISTSYGIKIINVLNKSVTFSNCSLVGAGSIPYGSPRLINLGGGFYEIAFISGSTSQTESSGLNINILSRSGVHYSGSPFSISNGGWLSGFGVLSNLPYVLSSWRSGGGGFSSLTYSYINSSGNLVSISSGGLDNTKYSVGFNQDSGLFSTSKVHLSTGINENGQAFDTLTNNLLTSGSSSLLQAGYIFSNSLIINSKNYIIFYDLNGNSKFYTNNALLSYPNWTVSFRNSITNSSIGQVIYSIYNSTGALMFATATDLNSNSYIGNFFQSGNNFKVFVSSFLGYNKINETFNISNGTYTKYIYLQPNSSFPSRLHINFYNSETNALISTNISYTIGLIENGIDTGCTWREDACGMVQNGTLDLNNISFGNYTLFYRPLYGTYEQPTTDITYTIMGAYYTAVYLTPIYQPSICPPRVVDINTSVIIISHEWTAENSNSVNISGGGSVFAPVYTNFDNPPSFCINQTIYTDVKVSKCDGESVTGRMTGNFLKENLLDYILLPLRGAVNGYANLPWILRYNETGVYTIFAYSYSHDYPYILDFIIPYQNGYTFQKNITVVNCDGANFSVNGDLIEDKISTANPSTKINNKPVTNLIKWFYSLFGVTSPEAVSQISLAIVFIFSFVLGIIGLVITRDFSGLLFGAGGTGFLGVLFFYVFGCIALGIAFLLAVCFVAIGSIAFFKGFQGGTQ
jgi:hypothetical protein